MDLHPATALVIGSGRCQGIRRSGHQGCSCGTDRPSTWRMSPARIYLVGFEAPVRTQRVAAGADMPKARQVHAQISPSLAGRLRPSANHFNLCQGKAISAVQPLSTSLSSSCTAHSRPGKSQ